MKKFIMHFIDLVREIKKVNIYLKENNTLATQLLQSQKETNEKLDRVANLESEFIATLTHFVAKREKQMIEQQQKEALREVESKPTPHDLVY